MRIMGLVDFVKNAGEKIFGKDKPEFKPQVRDVDPAKLEQMKRTKALQNLLQKYALEVKDLKISIDGDTATVSGQCDSQAEREKVVLALGNVAGIARVDDRLEVVKPEPPAQLHTVVAGDTLSKIAKKYYGNASKYPVIFEANKPMLKDPDKIYPGQVLRIPPQAA
jgi:nucleoid-associated protein YgaU